MAKLFTSVEIATLALRKIGYLPTSESAAGGEELRVTLENLDLILAEMTGTNTIFSLVGPSYSMLVKPDQWRYKLKDELGGFWPTAGLQTPLAVWSVNTAGRRYELPIVTRDVWERYRLQDETGAPEMVYIDREAIPTLYLFPTPRLEDADEWYLELIYQQQSPNVAPGGVAGNIPQDKDHGLRQAWQAWLVKKLAYEIGSGPVATLPPGRLQTLRADAEFMFDRLIARDGEGDNLPPIASSWEPGMPYDRPVILDYVRKLK